MDAWNVLMAAAKLTAYNAALVGACRGAAARTKKALQHSRAGAANQMRRGANIPLSKWA
jgi:hypothetical protein